MRHDSVYQLRLDLTGALLLQGAPVRSSLNQLKLSLSEACFRCYDWAVIAISSYIKNKHVDCDINCGTNLNFILLNRSTIFCKIISCSSDGISMHPNVSCSAMFLAHRVRYFIILLLLLAFVGCVFVLAFGLGPHGCQWPLNHKSEMQNKIFLNLRLPRVVMGMLVGAGLAMGGLLTQAGKAGGAVVAP